MTRLLLLAALEAAIAGALCLFMALPLRAHQAEAGWLYDSSCCSGEDCAQVPDGLVTPTPDGYRVQIGVDDHPLAFGPIDVVIPYGDKRIVHSHDEHFHVCIGKTTNSIFCVYVPDTLG
jgi:hypothetical protein